MKRALMAAIVTLATGVASGATAQKVAFNLRLGAGASTFSGPDRFSAVGRLAGGGGVGLAVSSSDRVTVRPELLYLVKSAEVTPDSGISGTYRISYLQIPVFLDVYLPGRSAIRPRGFAGPAISFVWSCTWRSLGDGSSYHCNPQNGHTAAADLGAILGGGVDLPLGGIKGTLEGRYEIGLGKAVRHPTVLRNRSLIVFAGISLPLHQTIIPPDST